MELKKNSSGFTIIELMIAASVFAVILLIVSISLVRISHIYSKGIITSRTQEVARAIMDEVTHSIRFNGGNIQSISHGPSVTSGYCIGPRRLSVRLGKMLTETPGDHGLIADTLDVPCSSMAQALDLSLSLLPPTQNPQEFLLPEMRISDLSITPLGNSLFAVNLKIAYGVDDLLDNPATTNPTCKQDFGRQFCTVLSLNTVIQKRLE